MGEHMVNDNGIRFQETVLRMVAALEDEADHCEMDLAGAVELHDLDKLFGDGGEARCEHFCDVAWEYALQFGEFAGTEFENAQSRCVSRAWKEIRRKHKVPNPLGLVPTPETDTDVDISKCSPEVRAARAAFLMNWFLEGYEGKKAPFSRKDFKGIAYHMFEFLKGTEYEDKWRKRGNLK